MRNDTTIATVKRKKASGVAWLATALVAGMLMGCTGGMSDLEQYVTTTKQQAKAPIEPIPTLREYEPYAYPPHERDPFDKETLASELAARARAAMAGMAALDPNRPIEYLENFPLDTLRMVGTLEQAGRAFGLVRTPDRTIYRVSVGEYMGQNYGRITAITETGIELVEVIADITDGYRERPMTVALSAE